MSRSLNVRKSKKTIPVGKILCLGLNYNLHIDEMKSEKPSEPVIFTKPPTALLENGGKIIIPAISNNVHHEVELVVVIGKESHWAKTTEYGAKSDCEDGACSIGPKIGEENLITREEIRQAIKERMPEYSVVVN